MKIAIRPWGFVAAILAGALAARGAAASTPDGLVTPRPLGPEPHPYTAKPGTFQIEIAPLSFAYNDRNADNTDSRSKSFTVPLLLKTGLTENMDIQLGMDFVLWERVREEGVSSTNDGVSDLTLRLKYNLQGNDGNSDVAVAMLPFVVLPVGDDDFGERGIRGGMIVPIEWGIDDLWTFNVAPSAAAVRDSENEDLELEIACLFTLTRTVSDTLDLWTEFEASATTEEGDRWIGTVFIGATHAMDDKTVLDLSLGFGVTDSADDFSVGLTLVRRF